VKQHIECVRGCKKDMDGHPPHNPERWSCDCGITARLQLRSAIDKMLETGFSIQSIADPGKRVILPLGRLGKWYLVYEEPIESEL
jgi:hypothetical protein